MRFTHILTICAALVTASITRGAPPASAEPVVEQVYPAEPISRLGSHRFVHPGRIRRLAFSPNGRAIFAVCEKQTCLWDVSTGRTVWKLVPWNRSAVLSRDGSKAVLAWNDETIRIVDATTGRQVAQLTAAKGRYGPLAVSPDGGRVAVTGEGQVVLWDVATAKQLNSWKMSPRSCDAMRFSPDGHRLAIAVGQAEMHIFDVDGNEAAVRLEGGTGFTGWLEFSPDGKTVAGSCEVPIRGGSRSSLRFWDSATGRARSIVSGSFSGGEFSPDGKWLAATRLDAVVVYDAQTAKPVHVLLESNDYIRSVVFSSDGRLLATGQRQRIRFWEAGTWREVSPGRGHTQPVQTVAFSPDGRTIATGGLDGTIILWSWPEGCERSHIDVVGSSSGVKHLTFSPDGRTLAATARINGGDAFHLFDPVTGALVSQFGKQHLGISAVAFLSSGAEVLTGNRGGELVVWDASSGEFVRSVGEGKDRIEAVLPGRDAGTAWWAAEGRRVGLRDLTTGEDLRVLDMASNSNHLVVSPCGQWVARGYYVQEAETGEVLAKGQRDVVAVSPDGRLLAIANLNEGIVFWERLTRQEIHTFPLELKTVKDLAFSPDGTVLAAAGYVGTVVWDMTGCLQNGRLPALKLTAAEMESLWKALGDDDAWAAHQAAWTLAAGGEAAVTFLAERLHPATEPDLALVRTFRKRLGDPDYDARELAARELVDLGIELTRKQIKALRRPDPRPLPLPAFPRFGEREPRPRPLLPPPVLRPLPERLRSSRAVAALQRSRAPAAKSLLTALADGAPEAPLTRESKAAFTCVRRRAD